MRFHEYSFRILNEISLKYLPWDLIDNMTTLVQIMAWCRSDEKPFSEAIMDVLLTHLCITQPQWVNHPPHTLYFNSKDLYTNYLQEVSFSLVHGVFWYWSLHQTRVTFNFIAKNIYKPHFQITVVHNIAHAFGNRKQIFASLHIVIFVEVYSSISKQFLYHEISWYV